MGFTLPQKKPRACSQGYPLVCQSLHGPLCLESNVLWDVHSGEQILLQDGTIPVESGWKGPQFTYKYTGSYLNLRVSFGLPYLLWRESSDLV